jgi:hypothetical protein
VVQELQDKVMQGVMFLQLMVEAVEAVLVLLVLLVQQVLVVTDQMAVV